MPKNIVVFKIDKKIDFKNHLIGIDAYKRHKMTGEFLAYYKKLANAGEQGKYKIFLEKTKNFYAPSRKKFRDLLIKDTQEAWNLVEKKYIKKLEKIHNRKFPYGRVYGIISTAYRYGYSVLSDRKWFACSNNSPFASVDIAMHEIMHFMFHYYFMEEWKKKFGLVDNQMWAIKESFSVLLNLECGDLMFSFDRGYPDHKKLREIIAKNWGKSKDFEKVLDKTCGYVKKNKLFL
jgi:hypothetical protein